MSWGCRNILPVLAIALAGFAPAAWAYLDPSTGSMIVSAIVGLFASLVLAVKTYWFRLVGLVRRVLRGSRDKGAAGGHGE